MFSKKTGKRTPEISTASLPDIIFMLLFFFMVVTVMREDQHLIDVEYPKATELTKIEHRSVVSNIYIGPPAMAKDNSKLGSAPRIQLNDQFASIEQIIPWVKDRITDIEPKRQPKFTVSLKVDSDTKMGLISDVKQELRKAEALKVNYSAVPRLD